MLFADFDWNQVLMKGLIGAVIGGVIGLFVAIAKKAQAKKQKGDSRDDEA
jgi:gas vesicle protein